MDGALVDPIENPERVVDESDDANLGASRQARCRFRCKADAVDHIAEPLLDRFSYRLAGVGGIPSQYSIEIGECPTRVDNLHACRYLAKSALISAGDTLSPASIEAIAASMIWSSSWVAI